MQRILHPLKNKVAMWYLGDNLIPFTSFREMIGKLQPVLEAITAGNLTLNQKILAIQQFPRPQNKHELRRFLGLCGLFRRSIPDYA